MSERICCVDDCAQLTGVSGSARGLCRTHYRLWRQTGDPQPKSTACRWCASPIEGVPASGCYCSSTCATESHARPDAIKQCKRCAVEKLTSQFQRRKKTSDGLAYVCRQCDNEVRVQRRIAQGVRRPDPPPGWKWCARCETEKPHDEFYVRKSGPHAGKTHTHCRVCVRADNVARGRRNGAQPKRPADPYAIQKRRLKTYGLTLDDYWSLLAKQRSRCAGCELHWDNAEQWFSVDHDHRCCPGTGSCGACVRGLLCAGCNFAAGHCGDDPEVLRRLARYLEQTAQGVLFRSAG